MESPCKKCVEQKFCQGELPCRKRMAYLRWKEKAASLWKDKKVKNG